MINLRIVFQYVSRECIFQNIKRIDNSFDMLMTNNLPKNFTQSFSIWKFSKLRKTCSTRFKSVTNVLGFLWPWQLDAFIHN